MRAMLDQVQQGRCAICPRADEPLIFDHCHATGLVRALVCHRCNPLEGREYLRDPRMAAYRARPYAAMLGYTVPYRSHHRPAFCSAAREGGPCQLHWTPSDPREAARYLAEHAALTTDCLTLWRKQQGPPRGIGRVRKDQLPAFFGRKPTVLNGWQYSDRRGGSSLPQPDTDGLYDEAQLLKWGRQHGVLNLDTGLPNTAR